MRAPVHLCLPGLVALSLACAGRQPADDTAGLDCSGSLGCAEGDTDSDADTDTDTDTDTDADTDTDTDTAGPTAYDGTVEAALYVSPDEHACDGSFEASVTTSAFTGNAWCTSELGEFGGPISGEVHGTLLSGTWQVDFGWAQYDVQVDGSADASHLDAHFDLAMPDGGEFSGTFDGYSVR